jgi:SH3 domain-containing YSC84-like protein 1
MSFLHKILAVAVLLLPSLSQANAESSSENKILREARYTWEEMKSNKDQAIPRELVRDCAGILVFPGMIKGGFFIGGTYGEGVFFHKDKRNNSWHGPVFINMGGASFGLQIGVASVDVIMLVMNERGVEAISGGKLTLGSDLSVAAGPLGKDIAVDGDAKMNTSIFSYYRSKGLFAGVSLKGAYMTPSKKSNNNFYNTDYTPYQILFDLPLPRKEKEVVKLIDTFKSY